MILCLYTVSIIAPMLWREDYPLWLRSVASAICVVLYVVANNRYYRMKRQIAALETEIAKH